MEKYIVPRCYILLTFSSLLNELRFWVLSRKVELWMIYSLKNTFQNISVKNNEYVPTYSPDLLRKKSCTPNVLYSPKKEIGNCNVDILFYICV